jgi:hypothetical protein
MFAVRAFVTLLSGTELGLEQGGVLCRPGLPGHERHSSGIAY